ncbi:MULTISPECIES: hypothetical protein [unclassified Diaminobutyricimonas]|uniref:hypothetical protein n=1 Tax=unclassified Diaminobutyricimonas TaxID=2643261 RepID=UPI0012F4F089|nr:MULTISPECIES: hypothetical protein [unclassified Diaminobutyricimonas]
MTIQTVELVIRGTLSPAFTEAFPGFTVTRVEHGRTHLVGAVEDQASWHGLLDVLPALNIELVSVSVKSSDAETTDNPT